MGKFVMRKTNTGIKFDLKAGNGEVIATSEVYASEAACKKFGTDAGIGSVSAGGSAQPDHDRHQKGSKQPSPPHSSTTTGSPGICSQPT